MKKNLTYLFTCSFVFCFMLVILDEIKAQQFSTQQVNAFGLTVPGGYYIDLADMDGDGDYDAFIGLTDTLLAYQENIGTPTQAQFAAAVYMPFGLQAVATTYHFEPRLVDVDGDGDMDLFNSKTSFGTQQIHFYENIGTSTIPLFDAPQINPFGLTGGNFGLVDFADWDNDGDQDMVLGGEYLDILTFENIGTATAPQFDTPKINAYGFSFYAARYYLLFPAFVDLDNDGDIDLLSNGPGASQSTFELRENVGTTGTPNYGYAYAAGGLYDEIPFGLNYFSGGSVPTTADIDNDGDVDVFCIGSAGIHYFENIRNPNNVCVKDDYEPNNTLSLASDMGLLTVFNSNNNTRICPEGDFDWFSVTTTSSKPNLLVKVNNFLAGYGGVMVLDRDRRSFLADGFINHTGKRSITLQNLQPGTYYVKVYGVPTTSNATYDLHISTYGSPVSGGTKGGSVTSQGSISGLKTSGLSGGVSIYPNPVRDLISMQVETEKEDLLAIMITDISGKVVRRYSRPVREGLSELQLNLDGLNDGVYLIRLKGKSGHYSQKFMIQK